VDAYTTLADAELAAATAAQKAAEGQATKGDELLAAEVANVAAQKAKQDPIDVILVPFVADLAAAKAAAGAALAAYNAANTADAAAQKIELTGMSAVGLWHHAHVAMSFTASKGEQTALATAVTEAAEALRLQKVRQAGLAEVKVKQAAELLRRQAQKALYSTAVGDATTAKGVMAASALVSADWGKALLLELAVLDSAEKVAAEQLKLPKVTVADVELVRDYRQAVAQYA